MISIKQGNFGSVIIEIEDEEKAVRDLITIMGVERGSTFDRGILLVCEKEKKVVIKLSR